MNHRGAQYLCIVALALLTATCGKPEQAHRVDEYAVITVMPTERTLYRNYSAAIRGRQDIDIYPQVSGTLTRLCVTEGARVKEGQILFVIDQVPYQAAYNTAKANVAAAEAALANAQLTYESREALHQEQVVSDFDLNTARNALLATKAQLAQAQAQALNARNNLSYTEVKSPSDGVVGTLPFRVGALVSPSLPQPLTTVSDNSTMYVYFSMAENQLLALIRQYGSKEAVLAHQPQVSLILNDGTSYSSLGKIESISGVLDSSTGTVSLRSVFDNKEGLLHSGGSGTIVIPTQYEQVIIIPQTATFELQDKVFVYKLIEGCAKSAPIEVERVNGGREYLVTSGLTAGDVLIAEGVGVLREGTPIQPKNVEPATAPKE